MLKLVGQSITRVELKLQGLRRWMSSAVVMSFGDGSQGAVGLPTSTTGHGGDAYEPTRVPGLPSDVTSVAAGHYHSLALTSQAQLWAWGRNNEAQLGRGPLDPRDSWNEPKRVEGLDKVNVCAAFASGVVSAAIGDDGSLWVWGKSKRGQLGLGKGIIEAVVPSRVEALSGEKIAKVSFGWGHALALTEDGKLFGWGYSADARLGKVGESVEKSPLESNAGISENNGQLSSSAFEVAEKLVLEGIEKEKDMPIVWDPSLVEELHGVEVVDISCGLDHSLVLCRNGTLLSCGSNVYGQLGRVKQDLGMLPVDISSVPLSIASGLGHSLAICRVASSETVGDDTNIVSWGWNQSSQLGRTGPSNVPLVVEGLAEEIPVSVSGGRVHSIVLTSKGEVWVWGCGKNGRLGLGSSCDEAEPILLDSLEGCEVLQVVSGFDHNLVLIAE
ncbi:secretion-regulating guanine nucleotide exchange factor [Quercus lobata]|uniref:RCC1-like domain-containing protein n=1 Tax=Quercus lobata TaxID=97700 RepID=A0A7N2LZ58_QUELO|nr:secretion-regulating guanine nucleotide exchange factor [Quercus lobata]